MLSVNLSVPAELAEVAADRLWSLGVVGIEQVDHDEGGIELRTSLGDERDMVERVLSDAFADGLATWNLVEVDESVADSWRQFARPTWIEPDLVVMPAWLEPREVFDAKVTVVVIEPGATFGAGDHPTTVLSLRHLRRALSGRPAARVLDVGCGSGVLAVAAVRLGARSADGIDIAPAAVPVTAANARRNGVDGAVSVSTTPLAEIDATYDVVVANILAPTLIELADDLVRVLAVDGVLIISGVLANRYRHVVAALSPLHELHFDELDGWAAISLSG